MFGMAPTTTTYPLSSTQKRLWFLDQWQPGSALYNVPLALRLRGPLDMSILDDSLNAVVRRHSILSGIYDNIEESPHFIPRSLRSLSFPVIDLSDIPTHEEREQTLQASVLREIQLPFDLKSGPLIRTLLIRAGATEHTLVLTAHQIAADEHSLRVLWREIAAAYSALVAHVPSVTIDELWPPPLQYVDYAGRQHDQLAAPEMARRMRAWCEHLSGASTLIELPTDFSRPALQSPAGAVHRFRLSDVLTDATTTFSRQAGVALFATLLAAFAVMLTRYSGQDEILVGAPEAGRMQPETENLIGPLANTLVLRLDVPGELTFGDIVRRAHAETLAAMGCREMPFAWLVAERHVERTLSYPPLVQVLFDLQDKPAPLSPLADVDVEALTVHAWTSAFELHLTLHERAQGGLDGEIEYRTDLFQAETIVRLADQYQRVLEQGITNADQPVASLSLLPAAERIQLLEHWNATAHDISRDVCIQELVVEQARRTPDAVAVVCGEEQLTYAALVERAELLADALRARGVGTETLVGLCVERSAALVVGVLGILLAGGAYVPLDPGYPAERLAMLIRDASVPVLLTQQHLWQNLPSFDGALLCLDDTMRIAAEAARYRAASHASAPQIAPDNLAYVIYTSGSTGVPKGVGCCHTGVINLLRDFEDRQPLSAVDRGSLWTSLNFDVSVYEIFSPLVVGASLHIVPEDVRVNDDAFFTWLASSQITSAYIPPFMLTAFAEWLRHGSGHIPLRRLLVGVEPIPPQVLAEISARISGLRIINGYGPTEATVCTTLYSLDREDVHTSIVPMGRPVWNSQAYVLDGRLEPVPIGMEGELYVGGVGLARGYWRRPELTAEKFIPNPFGTTPGARLYKTGDRVRWLTDGTLLFVGRRDFQVKIRGHRIELSEIEQALIRQPGVRDVVVLARAEDAAAGAEKRLVAYVVGDAASDHAGRAALRQALRQRLPEYMVPQVFVPLLALPLSPNGKLDRKALPPPEPDHNMLAPIYVAPSSPIEETLAHLWAGVLGRDGIGIHDDFFLLGGHSLQATQIISRMRAALRADLPLRVFFERPTIAEQAYYITQHTATHGLLSEDTPIPRSTISGPAPLSFAQQRLWFLDQLAPNNSFYNVFQAFRLEGALDIGALEAALNEIVRRHQALRTTFALIDGSPRQLVAALRIPLVVQRIAGTDRGDREAAAARAMVNEARRPFDLTRGPLIRTVLLELGEHEHILLLNMHHIVADGWSLGVFARELEILYAAFTAGHASPLPEQPIQYTDFAIWQRDVWLRGERLERQLAYWREQLASVPDVLEIPSDHPRPAALSYRGAAHAFTLREAVLSGLHTLSQREGATLFMTLMAAFKVLLYRYTGQEDIVVGTPIAGRSRPELEEMIGFFANTLVLRTDLSGNLTFREALGRVRSVALAAYAHQDVPFEKLVETLRPERRLSHTPVFQVLLALLTGPVRVPNLLGARVSPVEVDVGVAKFDLTMHLIETPDALLGELQYNTDMFEPASISRMLDHYQNLLAAVVADPEQRLLDIPLARHQAGDHPESDHPDGRSSDARQFVPLPDGDDFVF